MESLEGDGAGAAGEADTVADRGDGSDIRVATLVTRNEQHLGLLADVDRERDGHVGEDDDVLQRNQQQFPHGSTS